MEEIVKIVIKGTNGYFDSRGQFKDKVTLTKNSISYEYKPTIKTETTEFEEYFRAKWSYKTSSVFFKTQFELISKMMPKAIEQAKEVECLDAGEISFIVTYSDKTKIMQSCFGAGDCFEELFNSIKVLCPIQEDIPEVLKTSEDYEE